jgi:DNA-binding SARP family transcriptional activator
MIEAHMALDNGGGERALRALEKFFSIGRKFGFLKHHLFIPRLMTGLCRKALEEGIETEHVKRLICECSFVPDPPPIEMEQWPWPVRIFTFGRFSIIRRGQAVKFQGKAMKKPMEMLKVIIALGGRDIPEASLTDILWPDAEGPASHRSFTITLHRLRAILDCPGAITLSNGCVSLDPGCCRVDTWAFERAMSGADKAMRRGERDMAMKLFGSAVEVYHGAFLAGDTEAPWSMKTRERLRSKFMRCASDLGKLLEESAEYEKAADSYSRAIEVDSLAEGLYRSLMLCYRAMGRRAEAMALYRRLERVLEKELGLRPRPSTEALYRDLLKARG